MKYVPSFVLLALGILGCFFACSPSAPQTSIPIRFDLNGEWELIDPSNQQSYPATVPGTVHTDLLANEVIPDPFFRNNEPSLQYLEKQNWIYRRQFKLSEADLEANQIELICDGLDTYAKIILNGEKIGSSYNMFRQWSYDVRPDLRVGDNELEIQFTSPFQQQEEKVKGLGFVLPADNEAGELKYSPFCRKAPYHFGWDWGPRLMSTGIWKDIYLLSSSATRLLDYSVQTLDYEEEKARLVLKTIVESAGEETLTVTLDDLIESQHELQSGTNEFFDTFTVAQPQLWWPNGHGAAHLYQGHLKVQHGRTIIADDTISYGIRTIELVNEKDSIGTSFYFVVNGKPIFAKGANYIPQDVFIPRVKDAQYRQLLQAAQSANMNMLRVWGGGIYEKDIFYELCDSLGLLVWQDFMFAGTMYPIDEEFMRNVEAEVRYQVNRLSKHPCIATWCGNNEIEVAWHNWGWQEKYKYTEAFQTQLWDGYVSLFKQNIPRWIKEEGMNTAYTSSSPLSNWGTAENFNHSSMHYWGVWHGRDDIDAYRENVGRFMVEYGMQSYPDISTIARFSLTEDLALDSEVMVNRQKSYIGNPEILRLVKTRYPEPTDFADFVAKSQAIQAEGMRMAITAHRESNGHCMGSLVWQLNDCWPGPSWSIIDYYGKPKKAYVAVKEAFEE